MAKHKIMVTFRDTKTSKTGTLDISYCEMGNNNLGCYLGVGNMECDCNRHAAFDCDDDCDTHPDYECKYDSGGHCTSERYEIAELLIDGDVVLSNVPRDEDEEGVVWNGVYKWMVAHGYEDWLNG